jgi:hypothetical protein
MVNDLPYKHDETLDELMKSALRTLRRTKHDQGTVGELELLKRASDKLEHVKDHRKLCYG